MRHLSEIPELHCDDDDDDDDEEIYLVDGKAVSMGMPISASIQNQLILGSCLGMIYHRVQSPIFGSQICVENGDENCEVLRCIIVGQMCDNKLRIVSWAFV